MAACGEVGGDTTTSPVATKNPSDSENNTEPTETEPQFSTTKYEGKFTVYARTNQGSYNAEYIMATEQNGDVVNDAAYKVCCNVADRFGVELTLKEAAEPVSTLDNDIKSGDDIDYDIMLDRRSGLAKKATAGSLYDFNELGVNLSADWWDANCVRDLTLNGKNFMMGNSVSIAKLLGSRFFYYNKEIIKDFNLTDPYSLLDSDNWTLEEFLNLVKGVSAPIDGSLGQYGLVLETGESNGVYMHMLTGCGIKYAETDNDGTVVCTLGDQLDKIDQIYSKLTAVFKDKNYVLTMDEAVSADTTGESAAASGKYDKARALWASGHFLFTHSSMATSKQFTEMEDDYGCMPNPKYNKDQTEYVHKCDRYTLIWAIPNTTSIDKQKVADIMDYWGYQAEKEVIPAYYELTIKSKRFSESKASEVVDLVRRTTRYELIDIFDISNARTALSGGWDNGSVAAKWNAYSKGLKTQMDNFNKTIKGMN